MTEKRYFVRRAPNPEWWLVVDRENIDDEFHAVVDLFQDRREAERLCDEKNQEGGERE